MPVARLSRIASTLLVLAGLLAGLLAQAGRPSAAAAEDWPQWGGRDERNMVARESGIPEVFVPGEKKPDGSGIDLRSTSNVRWIARLGSQTYGNPTVAGGRLVVGTNDFDLADSRYRSTRGGVVKCLDEATGKLLWKLVVPRYETNKPGFNFDCHDLGVCSSPTIDGDRVYLVSSRGEVLCLDVRGMSNGNDGPFRDEAQYTAGPGRPPIPSGPRDADVLWRFDMIAELPVWPQDAANCSVVIHGDLVYVCTSNGVDASHDRLPYPLAPTLIALDKRTGRLVAKDDEKIGTRTFHGNWSNPSLGRVGDKTLLFLGGGDGVCYAFKTLDRVPPGVATLKKVWSFDCLPPHYRLKDGKPIPYRSGDYRLRRGNTNDGTFLGPSEIIATPAFCDGRVYVAVGQDTNHGRGRGVLSAIDATRTGDVTATGCLWQYDKIERSISTVAVADGLLYAADFAGTLHCLDARTGSVYWTHATKTETWSSPFVVDGKVFLGTQKSLWVLAAGKNKKVLHEIRLGSPVHSTPIAANGVLYVTTHRYLWAVQSPKQ